MTPFWDWEVPFILWLQQGHPAWTPFFRLLTALGNEELVLMLGPLVLWCINKAWGTGVLLLLLGSQGVNTALKELFRVPRPFLTHPQILQLDTPTGWSLPSGHAQNSTALWMYLASKVRRAWFWGVAVLLVVGICLSRPYLGVHYPSDVIVGVAVGLALWGLALLLTPAVTAATARLRLGWWLAGVAAVGVRISVCARKTARPLRITEEIPGQVSSQPHGRPRQAREGRSKRDEPAAITVAWRH